MCCSVSAWICPDNTGIQSSQKKIVQSSGGQKVVDNTGPPARQATLAPGHTCTALSTCPDKAAKRPAANGHARKVANPPSAHPLNFAAIYLHNSHSHFELNRDCPIERLIDIVLTLAYFHGPQAGQGWWICPAVQTTHGLQGPLLPGRRLVQ